ncbi:MAG: rRNA maturation RNase YbeY [Synergistaceae bacterium]|nr:rRNA maturation RNase YbeY [Synergistaceae bacterium]
MIIKLIVEGKEHITERINTDTDDFLKRIEALYASVLNNKENFPEECGCAEISLSIVDPERIRELNLSYRDIDSSTDILSFPLWEEDSHFVPPPGWECLPLGDIVICPDKISENADENNKSFTEELVLVMSHGLLHLIGYDHYDIDSERKMWMKQDRMVEQFFKEEGAGYEIS